MQKYKNIPHRFHIGTQKAASTFLYNLLSGHSEITLSKKTEVNFFFDGFEKGLDYYQSLFADKPGQIDTSPKYFMLPDTVPARIKEYADKYLDEKPLFILILRNPIDYLNSHYEMQKIQDPCIGGEDKRKTSLVDYVEGHPGYIKRAQYGYLLEEWLKYFDIDQFKIISFEDFVRNKDVFAKEILNFWRFGDEQLSVETVSKNKALRNNHLHKLRSIVNKNEALKEYLKNSKWFIKIYDKFLTKSSDTLSQGDRDKLAEKLAADVARLKKLSNNDFSFWKDF